MEMQHAVTVEDLQSRSTTGIWKKIWTVQLRLHTITHPFTLLCIALAASIPRILLANQLDIVTDEVVYIHGGKLYLPLIAHLTARIGNNDWLYNYEHPPFAKLLIGLTLWLNGQIGHPLPELFAARLPSILCGTLLVMAVYALGRGPWGRAVAIGAALCLAFSPWLAYFSALAYLDMTMTALITVAYLLLWYALRRPWLYPVSTFLLALGVDSKYTAVLAVPGMILFLAYYFLVLRPRLPIEQRPPVPWLWWLAAIAVGPLTLLAADPAIWPHPYTRFVHSLNFEWTHSLNGHLTFIAGQYDLHVPHWAILYILITKMSAFVTIPAALFVVFALVQQVRAQLSGTARSVNSATSSAFLLCWLLAMLAMFSLLNIVVGTHYHLPLAPPVALAGASGLAMLLRYRPGTLFQKRQASPPEPQTTTPWRGKRSKINLRSAAMVMVLIGTLSIPHLLGLIMVHNAEGYTSELFHGEDAALQVAYPGYRDALQWLAAHTHGPARVGLAELPQTLSGQSSDVTWYNYNTDLSQRLLLVEAPIGGAEARYDYIVWPMHLIQRGYGLPPQSQYHIVHAVMGGNTIYCYIIKRTP